MKPIVLASSSRFRAQQLRALALPFTQQAPACEEYALPHESASQTALRLACAKAASLKTAFPEALIIGSDQVAWRCGQQLGKPLTHARALAMLHELSGQVVTFYTALVLLNGQTGALQTHVDTTVVRMRALSDEAIERYLAREPDALYCAGAAKSEGLGMSLIERIDSHDPNALIGLPMLTLVTFLLNEGVVLP